MFQFSGVEKKFFMNRLNFNKFNLRLNIRMKKSDIQSPLKYPNFNSEFYSFWVEEKYHMIL